MQMSERARRRALADGASPLRKGTRVPCRVPWRVLALVHFAAMLHEHVAHRGDKIDQAVQWSYEEAWALGLLCPMINCTNTTQRAEHGPLRVTRSAKDPIAHSTPGTERGQQIANDPVGTDVKRPNGLLSNCLQRKWAKKGVFLAVIRSYATGKPDRSFASMNSWYMALLTVLVLLQHQEVCCAPPGPIEVSWAGPTSRPGPFLIIPAEAMNPVEREATVPSETVIRSYATRKPARSFACMNSWYIALLTVKLLLHHQELRCAPPGPIEVSWAGPPSARTILIIQRSMNPVDVKRRPWKSVMFYATRKPARSLS